MKLMRTFIAIFALGILALTSLAAYGISKIFKGGLSHVKS